MTLLLSRTSRSMSNTLGYNYISSIAFCVKYKPNKVYFLICFGPCRWGSIEFPMPFGRVMSPTESFIHGLDEKVIRLSITFLHISKCLSSLTILSPRRLIYIYCFILEIHGKSSIQFGSLLLGEEVMIFGNLTVLLITVVSLCSLVRVFGTCKYEWLEYFCSFLTHVDALILVCRSCLLPWLFYTTCAGSAF